MDTYKDLILEGFYRHREHLPSYLIRNFRQAKEEEYFEADEFFEGCLEAVQALENIAERDYKAAKKDNENRLKAAKNSTLLPDKEWMRLTQQSYEEYRLYTIKHCKKTKKVLSPEDFPIGLYHITKGKFAVSILLSELEFIKDAIYKAYATVSLPPKIIPQPEHQAPVIKPIFKSEAIPTIFDLLKGYFPNQNSELQQVLDTGIVNEKKLLFHGNGKTLLDFFKQLMTGQFVTIAVQRDFETWVSNGFDCLHRGKQNSITPKYASKIISGNERAAKGNRLIDVIKVAGKFQIEQLEIKNREQN